MRPGVFGGVHGRGAYRRRGRRVLSDAGAYCRMMETLLPTGPQHELVAGGHRIVVTTVGATLREYTVDGQPVVDGFGPDQPSTFGRGQVLAPWPNRVRAGRYRFEGHDLQLPLDEPGRGNAIHGLVRWAAWTEARAAAPMAARAEAPMAARAAAGGARREVTLEHVIWPRDGYPFLVELSVRYALDEEAGLAVRMDARNGGPGPCPFGAGFHPYVWAGPGGVDSLTLRLPARTRLVTDERGIPVGEEALDGGRDDFRRARQLGATRLDNCFTGLERDGERRAEVRVLRPRGDGGTSEVVVWMDAMFDYVMVFTGDTLPPGQRRSGLAVEPMSCAPDALASGRGLVVLEPGESWSGSWGIRPAT